MILGRGSPWKERNCGDGRGEVTWAMPSTGLFTKNGFIGPGVGREGKLSICR